VLARSAIDRTPASATMVEAEAPTIALGAAPPERNEHSGLRVALLPHLHGDAAVLARSAETGHQQAPSDRQQRLTTPAAVPLEGDAHTAASTFLAGPAFDLAAA